MYVESVAALHHWKSLLRLVCASESAFHGEATDTPPVHFFPAFFKARAAVGIPGPAIHSLTPTRPLSPTQTLSLATNTRPAGAHGTIAGGSR